MNYSDFRDVRDRGEDGVVFEDDYGQWIRFSIYKELCEHTDETLDAALEAAVDIKAKYEAIRDAIK